MARHTAKSHKIRKVEILVIQMRIFLTVNWIIILQTIIIQVLFWMQSILGRMFPVDIILILRSTGLFPLTLMGADR